MAESVKALQSRGHTPCSPKTLRRAHSVATASSPYAAPQQQQQQQQQQKPREQIYAPVAHLQQKIAQRDAAAQQQQQQQMLLQQQHQQQLHQQQHHSLSPDGDKYGFGMKFQTHQSHFYQQMVDSGVPMLSPPGEQQQQVRL